MPFIIWFPIFVVNGKQVNARCRLIDWKGFHLIREDFGHGKLVIRLWTGILLFTIMVQDYHG